MESLHFALRRPESGRSWRRAIGLVVLAAAIVVTGLLPAAPAQARKNPIKLFDGSASRAVPSSLTGWSVHGLDETRVVDITWRRWNTRRAIGIGTTVNRGCRALPCGTVTARDLSVWKRKRIRITAFAPRRGEYRRLKLFQWTAWNHSLRSNYHFTLAFTPGPRGPWRLTKLDNGGR